MVSPNKNANTKPAPANKPAANKTPPKGATAQCKDGSYSMSKEASGQCSGHGGVDHKLP